MVNHTARVIVGTLSLAIIICCCASAAADVKDPYDPFDFSTRLSTDEKDDANKTASELVSEAELLFMDDRPLDARTKLLRALRKAPNSVKAHKLLAGYYLVHVGHYRLALKYIKKTMLLLEEQYGPPPYHDLLVRSEHAHILHLLAQIRLNLDNYQGSLDVLEQYTNYGYYQTWLPGSKAWVLMKLERLDEAIRIARLGLMSGGEKGRTLNILGILLSMSGDRENSIRVFKEAIIHEMSLGSMGQPATPLNNSGEVYRETYQEDLAERSWKKAISLPDGCEHVLPSLNLAILFLEQNSPKDARESIDNFEACVAQYPLRNGEEHRALVHLARGRIKLAAGNSTDAVTHLESALDKRQWFGKIGASQEDLTAATMISLAQALGAQSAAERFRVKEDWSDWATSLKQRTHYYIRRWWLLRRARQILTEQLKGIEDLFVRNTDSVIDYPAFGEALALFPLRTLRNRIKLELDRDPRSQSYPYYKQYLAEGLLNHGHEREADKILREVIADCRPKYDDALKLRALLTRARLFDENSVQYLRLVQLSFRMLRASVRNSGFRLPISHSISNSEVRNLLEETAFKFTDGDNEFHASHEFSKGRHILSFRSKQGLVPSIKVSGKDLTTVVNQFNDAVFSEKLS